MQASHQQLIHEFIAQIWNKRNFEKLNEFIHPGFKDHSLPPTFPMGVEGLKKWIEATGLSFEHTTIIEDQVSEGEKTILKIRMVLKHTGEWRGIAPTGLEVNAVGYRFYKLAEGKIIEHWGLIDGQAIENQLRNAAHGCKIGE